MELILCIYSDYITVHCTVMRIYFNLLMWHDTNFCYNHFFFNFRIELTSQAFSYRSVSLMVITNPSLKPITPLYLKFLKNIVKSKLVYDA